MKYHKKMNYRNILSIIMRTFSYMKGAQLKYVFGSLLSLLKLLTVFLIPYLYQYLIKCLSEKIAIGNVLLRISIPFLLLVMCAPLVCLGDYWQKTCANIVVANMQKDVFAHVMRMPRSNQERDRADLLMRSTSNTQRAVSLFTSHTIIMLFKFIIYFGVALVLLIIQSWLFALFGIAFSIIIFYFSTVFNIRLRTLESCALNAETNSMSNLMELVINIPIVKLFSLKDHMSAKFQIACEEMLANRSIYNRFRGIVDGTINFVSYSVQACALMLGVYIIGHTEMSFAKMVFIAGVLDVMLSGMREISFFIQFIQGSIVNSERVFEILGEEIERNEKSEVRLNLKNECAVEFKNVNFSYDGKKPALRNINCRFMTGQTTAIVGLSGCGKSTLIRLIERFYEVDAGEIWFFGISMENLNISATRDLFSYIPQDAGLFDGTIEENVRLGKPYCGLEEVKDAVCRASLSDDISNMYSGYASQVGENGIKISGGQRQRVSIARAFVKDAPVYLLDEATSALDSRTENEIFRLLNKEGSRTIIIISHRLTTLSGVDKIIYMEDGEIVDVGTHDELFSKGGGYYELCKKNMEVLA